VHGLSASDVIEALPGVLLALARRRDEEANGR
jgi:hypothetical protein